MRVLLSIGQLIIWYLFLSLCKVIFLVFWFPEIVLTLLFGDRADRCHCLKQIKSILRDNGRNS